MKASYKSRVVGSVVVLMVLLGIALVVLSRKQELPKALVKGDNTHQVLSLPLISEAPQTDWHAQQSQKAGQAPVLVAQAKHPENPIPSSEPKPIKTGYSSGKAASASRPVILQVASFSSFRNAHNMRNRLSSLGYMPHIQVVRINNKDWYRLSAGPFKDRAQALLAQQTIFRKWKLSPKIRVAH